MWSRLSPTDTAAWRTQPCLGFRFERALRTPSMILRRSSGLNLFHRSFASCDAAGFFCADCFFGPPRARAAALISLLPSFGETAAHRFFAPFPPPPLFRLLAWFFGRQTKIL